MNKLIQFTIGSVVVAVLVTILPTINELPENISDFLDIAIPYMQALYVVFPLAVHFFTILILIFTYEIAWSTFQVGSWLYNKLVG